MNVLITGAGGFLGSHLAEFLLGQGYTVHGAIHRDSRNVTHLKERLLLHPCDILNREQIRDLLNETQPDVIFHLAAQSLPTLSWQDPDITLRVNILGTLHLLEAVRKNSTDLTMVVACSSAEYGFTALEEIAIPIKEERSLQPSSPYGVSKVASDFLVQLYWRTYGMKIMRVRPFFIVGPKKTGDVCSDFARGIVAVERRQQEALKVGHLEVVRDFLDVRDAVLGLSLVVQKGSPGGVYNLCFGVGHKVRQVLDILRSLALRPIPVESDPALIRPSDMPVIIGDNSRLRSLGWVPRIPLERTLGDLLDYWRRVS